MKLYKTKLDNKVVAYLDELNNFDLEQDRHTELRVLAVFTGAATAIALFLYFAH